MDALVAGVAAGVAEIQDDDGGGEDLDDGVEPERDQGERSGDEPERDGDEHLSHVPGVGGPLEPDAASA